MIALVISTQNVGYMHEQLFACVLSFKFHLSTTIHLCSRINGPLEIPVQDYKFIRDDGDTPEHRILYF